MQSSLAIIIAVEAVGFIAGTWWAIRSTWRYEAALALTEALRAEFEERVPNGWIFDDGKGY